MKKHGFTLLLAVLVISVALSVSLGASTLVISQLAISRDARESLEAFYAANAGIECALYWDIQYKFDENPPGVSAFDPLNVSTTEIECNDADNPHFFVGGPAVTCVSNDVPCTDGRTVISNFIVDNQCVEITVEKFRSIGETHIISKGRNKPCPFIPAEPGNFERVVRVTY